MNITYEPDASIEDIQTLTDGIHTWAKAKKNQDVIERFAFFIKDDKQCIKGGCNGIIYYGCMYIDQMWVHSALRRQGFGRQLIQQAELLAREKHCRLITVDTMDWEAPLFYQKLGFEPEFERVGYLYNSTMYFFYKKLTSPQ